MADETWKTYSTTLRRLLTQPELVERFQQDMNGSATADLNISAEMRTDLKKLLLVLPSPSSGQADVPHSEGVDKDRFEEGALSAERFFEATYKYISRGTVATTVMSILIFLMGLLLLGVAAAQSISGNETGTAIVVASSGIVAIAAAFYRSPVTQVRESAAEMQRSSMILMSYMLGLSLLSKSLSGQRTAEESERLSSLTADLVALLADGKGGIAKGTSADG